MLGMDKHKEAGQSIFMSSMKGLANTGAVVVAFLATPMIYGASVDWVQRFTARQYGTGLDDLIALAWFAMVAFLTFYIARASLGTLLVMGGLALATRFL